MAQSVTQDSACHTLPRCTSTDTSDVTRSREMYDLPRADSHENHKRSRAL